MQKALNAPEVPKEAQVSKVAEEVKPSKNGTSSRAKNGTAKKDGAAKKAGKRSKRLAVPVFARKAAASVRAGGHRIKSWARAVRDWFRRPLVVRIGDAALFGLGAAAVISLVLAPVVASWWRIIVIFSILGLFLTLVTLSLTAADAPRQRRL